MARFINPITDMKPNGSLRFYKPGTDTELVTFKDELETIPNPTIVPVLPNGNIGNVFFQGSARVVYLDEFDQQYAVRDPVGVETGLGNFTLWVTTVSYDLNDIVKGSNGRFYLSLSNANIGNDPTLTAASWEEIRFTGVWNSNITYAIGNVVLTIDGNLWKSLTATAGNDPSNDDGTNWLPAINGAKVPEVIAIKALSSWDIPEIADFTGATNESRQIDASANTIDVVLPVLDIGDSFIYHNLITSTFKVQILNPIETIKGSSGDIAAGINMELAPGNSVQLVAKSATILSIVGVQI